MLERIKKWINNKQELTIQEKLEKIKKLNLDMYAKPYSITFHKFLEEDIVASIKRMKYINTFAIETQYIQLGSISEVSYREQLFSEWFTSNRKLISNKQEILNEWVDEAIKLTKLYEFRITLTGIKNNSYFNAKKIGPYYFEIINIANKIIV